MSHKPKRKELFQPQLHDWDKDKGDLNQWIMEISELLCNDVYPRIARGGSGGGELEVHVNGVLIPR